MPASEMSRLESHFHHSSLNMNYPVTMELPNHLARLRQSGHVFLTQKEEELGQLRSATLLCLGGFLEVRMCKGGAANFHGPITYMHGFE